MNIRFTSSLTPEDESVIAPAILKAMTAILDLLPIAYALRIDTADGEILHHAGSDGQNVPARVGVISSLRATTASTES